MKQEMISYMSTIKEDILSVSKFLYDNPENSYEEIKATDFISALLERYNFKVTKNYLDIPASFYAEYGSSHPKICFICEYDALKEAGHVYGHNLISAMSIGAGLSLTKVMDKLTGSVVLLGCPGENLSGTKTTMLKQGAFDDIDIVLMAHPDITTAESCSTSAVLPLVVSFNSKSASKFSPMDGGINTLLSLERLSKGFDNDCSINTLSLAKGSLPGKSNVEVEIKLNINAPKLSRAEKIREDLTQLVKSTSIQFNLDYDVRIYNEPCEAFTPNCTLSRIFSHNLKEVGIIESQNVKCLDCGISLGAVSQLVPCLHPYISIVEGDPIAFPSEAFAAATQSYYAQNRVIQVAQCLASTAIDLFESSELFQEIKSEHSKILGSL